MSGRKEGLGRAPGRSAHLSPALTTVAFDTFWRFAAERQQIFYRRMGEAEGPWTGDAILLGHKFTNAYRASDRVSQHLIRHVIYRDDLPSEPAEIVFRILLFKLFNSVSTWRLLEAEVGPIVWAEFEAERYARPLAEAMARGERIYSAAYIMPPGGSSFGHAAKHRNHLTLLATMMRDGLPDRLATARGMQQAFETLKSYPTIGDFLAYQFVTDINYSEVVDFSESEFVVPGPGARDGIAKCFADRGGLSEAEVIRLVADIQEAEFERLGIAFPSLWGRRLQLIDCQNLFCEVDKYSRVAHPEIAGRTGRLRIKQRFSPSTEPPIDYMYPPKWNLRVARSAIPNEATPLGVAPATRKEER